MAESKTIPEPIERKLSIKGNILVKIDTEQYCDLTGCNKSCADCLVEIWNDEIGFGEITNFGLEIKK